MSRTLVFFVMAFIAAATQAGTPPAAPRAGSAATDFAPRPALTSADAPRNNAAVCTTCRRAAAGGDVVMFWLLFGGAAKEAPAEARKPADDA